MGNPKQKWTTEEEEALLAGVNKYGSGKWKFIQKDPEFNKHLHSRSNIDLKDKWRNMSVSGQGSRPKSKTTQDTPVTPSALALVPSPAPPAPGVNLASKADHVKDDAAKDIPDSKNGPRYSEMIFDALSAEPNGLDIGSLVTYIEQRTEVSQNFRKQLGSKLRRLCQNEKLEKVENLYRMKDSSEANKTIKGGNGSGQSSSTAQCGLSELEEAAKNAAARVAEAENKSRVAAEAARELARITKLADEAEVNVLYAEDLVKRCAMGEIIRIPEKKP